MRPRTYSMNNLSGRTAPVRERREIGERKRENRSENNLPTEDWQIQPV
jgi:hypothetical protein